MSEIQEYKCPCCGGAISFDSSIQKMKCPYCDTEFEMESLKAFDTSLSEQSDSMEWDKSEKEEWNLQDDGLFSYVCNSCGGEIIGDENLGASSCPYCGNPAIIMSKFSGLLKPDYVIPFKLDKNAAKTALANHLKGKRLLPKVFKDENHIDEIKGIYVPFWLFDASVSADVSYKGTKVSMWEDRNNRYTRTSFYGINRSGKIAFENVPVDGSEKMDNALTESIEPFDFRDAVDFQTAYLSGYLADKYDVSSTECEPRANERIKRSTEEEIKSTVNGYATVETQNSSIRFKNGSVKYTLCPVWILNTNWNGQKYTFAMNGQTGKMVGDLPCDKGAYWKWFGSIAGISTAVLTGAFYLVHLLSNM